MSTALKTYSFRASADFGDRLAVARDARVELAARGPDVARWLNRELSMELARQRRRAPSVKQAAFLRLLAEAFVRATEHVAEGLDLARHEREIRARIGQDAEVVAWAQAGVESMADAHSRDGET